jgi:6-pyruvoyltetrahydropterin/6-carboxytetrahydropterin synthase
MAMQKHFEVYVQTHFSAAHHLRNYPGNCAKPHGHNWTVDIHIECDRLNEIGIGIDFRDVKAAVKAVLEELDHTDLNVLPAFQNNNPTSENIAQYLYQELTKKLNAPGIRLIKLRVSETANCGVWYWED